MNSAFEINREAQFSPIALDRGSDQEHSGFLPPVLLQYWHTAIRWRWIIIGIIGACFVVGLVTTLLMAPKYTGRALIEISREQKQITNVQGVESQQSGRDLEFYATQYALLRTRPLAERVSKELRLTKSNVFFEAHGLDDVTSEEEYKENPAKLEKLAADLLLKNVTISPVRTSRLVDVSYTSRSPELSTGITNAWAQAFIATSMDRQFASTADARRFLEERLETLRQRLEQSERQVVAYASRQGIVTLDKVRDEGGRTQASRTLVATDLEELNLALNKAIDKRIEAQTRNRASGELAPEAIASQGLAFLRQQRSEAASEYARLMVQHEPGYPMALEFAEKVKSIDASIARETRRISGSREQEYREALARENQLRERVEASKQRLDTQQRASIQYAIFQREADTNRQLYDALLQRYKEIGVAGTVGANNIAIVEPAQVPNKPSAPSLPINIAISLLVGVALAALATFGLEQIDEGIREPGQVTSLLGLPLLGHTPVVEGSVEDEISDTKSHFYEAYFSVRSNLAFSTNHGFPKSMMVTSTRPAEGKSSTSLTLATILGRTDKKVLLVDADMRSPSIHSMVSRPNAAGLSNVLSGEDNWQPLVQDSAYKGLSILPAGPIPPNAAELLSGERLGRLLEECLSAFDHVIIDSPPVLGLSDSPLISRTVEGCVFVIEAEGVAIRGIRSSIARLKMAQAHIFGVVLTKLHHREGGYGYGYGYGYGRRYGATDQEAGP